MNVTNRIKATSRLLSLGTFSRTAVLGRVLSTVERKDNFNTFLYFSTLAETDTHFNIVYWPNNHARYATFNQHTRKLHSSTANTAVSKEKTSQIVHKTANDKKFGELTTGEKVARVSKDATYTGVIVLGIAVTGVMFYAIGRELFSNESPSGVYGKALKLCKKNHEVCDTLGEPIKGYGETTRRGRRRYVSNIEYEKDGVKYMRMKFYIEGVHRKGSVFLEVQKNLKGKYEYRYLFVELDGYPMRTIILEDNRDEIRV